MGRLIEPIDNRTLRQLYAEAVVAQDACNLSGVVHAWSRSIHRLRQLYPGADTAFFNKHPVCVLYADKLADMTGSRAEDAFRKAWDAAIEHTRTEDASKSGSAAKIHVE